MSLEYVLSGDAAYSDEADFNAYAAQEESFATAMVKLAAGAPLTPIEYGSVLLSYQNSQELLASQTPVDTSSFSWSLALANGNSAFCYADHASNTVYIAHGAYTGSTQSGSVGALQLPVATVKRLQAKFNGERAAMGLAAASLGNYTLVFVSLALFTAAALVAVFAPETTAWIFLFRIALIGAITSLAIGAVAAVVTPTLQTTTCNTGSTSCCSTYTDLYGGTTTCVDCTGGTCNTDTQPSGPGPFDFLGPLALGIAAVAVASIGSYVAYRYVTNRPRPGFGNAPPFMQAHPGLAALPSQVSSGASRVYQGARSGASAVAGAGRSVYGAGRGAYNAARSGAQRVGGFFPPPPPS
jgi:hypothetical protein